MPVYVWAENSRSKKKFQGFRECQELQELGDTQTHSSPLQYKTLFNNSFQTVITPLSSPGERLSTDVPISSTFSFSLLNSPTPDDFPSPHFLFHPDCTSLPLQLPPPESLNSFHIHLPVSAQVASCTFTVVWLDLPLSSIFIPWRSVCLHVWPLPFLSSPHLLSGFVFLKYEKYNEENKENPEP